MNTLIKITFTVVLNFVMLLASAQESSNLWKIEGNGIKTSYVFGTMHLIPQKDFNLKPKVKTAFEASEQLVLELDMSHPDFLKAIMAHSYLENGEQLKSYMDDSEYELLDHYLKEKTGAGMQMYNSAKPFMLLSAVLMSLLDEPLASFELALMTMAKQANKKMDGLETYETQAAVFDSSPYEKQIDDLVDMIKNPDTNTMLFNKMSEIYRAEDIEALYGYMDDYMNNDMELMKKFLDDRNKNWIPEIAKFSKEHSTFYGVGAAHLGGEFGVINLLKNEGYTVTPLFDE